MTNFEKYLGYIVNGLAIIGVLWLAFQIKFTVEQNAHEVEELQDQLNEFRYAVMLFMSAKPMKEE